jgi:hypothetical protein
MTCSKRVGGKPPRRRSPAGHLRMIPQAAAVANAEPHWARESHQPTRRKAKLKDPPPVQAMATYFNDLRTLAAFFQEGPGQDIALLHQVRFLSISYIDDHAATDWRRRTTDYAYEAFEILYISWHLMQVSWLQLCLPRWEAISSIDDPGMWSLLKIRGLPHFTISGPHRCIAPKVRAWLKARTHKKSLLPWQPLGVENPGLNN